MCPLPVIMGIGSAAVGGMQAIAAYQGQAQQAKAIRQAAVADYEQKSSQLTRREVQEDDAANQKLGLQNLEEAKRGAEADVSAAQGGVSGISLDNLHADIARDAARNRETIRQNQDATMQQLQLEKKGALADAQGRINAAPKPSALGLVAGLGSSALSGITTYKRMK